MSPSWPRSTRRSMRRRSRPYRSGVSNRPCAAASRWREANTRWRVVSSSGTEMHAALLALLVLQQPLITKPPKLKKFVEAVYPEAKKQAGVEAQVLLSIDIAED